MAPSEPAPASLRSVQALPGVSHRPKWQRSHDAMLAAAIRLLAERGYNGTTLADVASAAGYSTGLAGHHFQTKAALLIEVVHEVFGQFRVVAGKQPQPATGLGAVLRYVTASFDLFDVCPDSLRAAVLAGIESTTTVPEAGAAIAAYEHNIQGGLRTAFAAGVRDGSIRDDLDPDQAAHFVFLVIKGVAYDWFLTRSVTTHGDREAVLTCVQALTAATPAKALSFAAASSRPQLPVNALRPSAPKKPGKNTSHS